MSLSTATSGTPPEATSQQTYLDDLDRQVKEAHEAGKFTAVLALAQARRDELQREFAELTAGHQVRWMTNSELEELRRQWTPEKARLNEQIRELRWRTQQWDYVVERAGEFAANEAYGWTVQADGSYTKTLDDGTVIGAGRTTVIQHEARRRVTRTVTRPAQRRNRERRPRVTRRTASSSSTASADPGSSDPDPEPATLRVRRPSGELATFEADELRLDAGVIWATGRWRRRVGLNYADIRYSHPATYGFLPREIVEVRA